MRYCYLKSGTGLPACTRWETVRCWRGVRRTHLAGLCAAKLTGALEPVATDGTVRQMAARKQRSSAPKAIGPEILETRCTDDAGASVVESAQRVAVVGAVASPVPTRQTVFDYDRTVVAFHGTRKSTAKRLVAGDSFGPSENDDDWLGHGVYFWEYAPQQAWWWAQRRYAEDAAVVGAMIRLGRCFDLLDPSNADVLSAAGRRHDAAMTAAGQPVPNNANTHKYRDCAIFNYMFTKMDELDKRYESARAVFVPLLPKKGLPRLWTRSGVFRGSHVQLSVREPNNILAVWGVRRDGRYGHEE